MPLSTPIQIEQCEALVENRVKSLSHSHILRHSVMLMDFPSSSSAGNVLFVTFVTAYSSRRQLDKEPSTDAAATVDDPGDVVLVQPDPNGDRGDCREDQHHVPDRQRASHPPAAEEVSLTDAHARYCFLSETLPTKRDHAQGTNTT